jgi:hypothetical protein
MNGRTRSHNLRVREGSLEQNGHSARQLAHECRSLLELPIPPDPDEQSCLLG